MAHVFFPAIPKVGSSLARHDTRMLVFPHIPNVWRETIVKRFRLMIRNSDAKAERIRQGRGMEQARK
jgi:hypothetical protein